MEGNNSEVVNITSNSNIDGENVTIENNTSQSQTTGENVTIEGNTSASVTAETGESSALSGIFSQRGISRGITTQTVGSIDIQTHLPLKKLIADGASVYSLIVRADSTGLLGVDIRSAEWDVVVPSYLTILNGKLPDGTNINAGPSSELTDFYYNFLMDSAFNIIDETVNNGELGDGISNVRAVDANEGPSDVAYDNGKLGVYNFTVNTGATLGKDNFDMNNVVFGDTNENGYYSPDWGTGVGVNIFNEEFVVLAQSAPNDADKFEVRDASDNVVAWFGSAGNIALKGTCYVSANCAMGAGNALTIATDSDDAVAFIDNSGNLCVQSGDCLGFAASCSSTTGLIVKDNADTQVSSLSDSGEVCALGGIYEEQGL